MVQILEFCLIGNLAYGLVHACQQALVTVDDGEVDVFDGGFTLVGEAIMLAMRTNVKS